MSGSDYKNREWGGVRMMPGFVSVVILLALFTNAGFAGSDRRPGEPFVCLGTARLTDPVYPETSLVLGWNDEGKENYREAMRAYNTCLESREVPKKLKKKVKERLTWLRLQITKQEIDSLIREWEEDSIILASAPASDSSLTVVPFVDVSEEQTLADFALGIVDFLIRDLIRVERLDLIERARMIELKRQLQLSDSSFMDPATAPRVGAILRVDKVISGTMDRPTRKDIQISAVIFSRKAKAYYPVELEKTGAHRLLLLQKELTFGILDRLDIRLTRRDTNEIKELFTESMEAFMAYCLGLARLDEGNYAGALTHFEEAVSLDPDFEPAKEMAKKARDLVEAGGEIEKFISACLSTLREVREDKARSGRLKYSGQKGTGNFIPTDPNSPPEDKQKDAVAPVGTVIIRGTIR